MIGTVDRQVKLTIVYAPNDRHAEAHETVNLADGEQARFCNPKYWETSGIEADAGRVVVLPFSPHLDAILSAHAEAGIPATVAGEAASSAASPAPGPVPVLTPPAPPPAPDPAVDVLPPWLSTRFTPGSYVERYAKATTPTAVLARRYVEAGRREG